ncbi:hypothetical protein H072_6860 [Dactylellina haptotyla CBS 200.50]|uniref:INSIG domain-containing protein n=1 Tax=Dactylellina haptotyla (strain CBS 200.50) TaxID=1284197 RepID=S8A8P3_DACHA|nr:hypothetical protein H072_6860 [Dactylellina haptotyla CBS 200.50]
MADADPPLYKPTPRRGFILGDGFDPSPTDTPTNDLLSPNSPTSPTDGPTNDVITPSKRSQSIRNLTTSALFGIYGPSAYDSVPGTPGATTRQSSTANLLLASLTNSGIGGTPLSTSTNGHISSPSSPSSPQNDFTGSDGSSLPSQRTRPIANLSRHHARRKEQGSLLQTVGKSTILFLAGASYGLIIARLHDQSHIAPVKVPVERDTPGYLALWGFASVVLGSIMPWADGMWEDYLWESGNNSSGKQQNGRTPVPVISVSDAEDAKSLDVTPVWNPAVRSIGAFVGIAYAIRKLPWESTSQASLTLAFVNPVLWYILDRTKMGFWLSTLVAIFGSLFLIGFNPDFVAIPSGDGVGLVEKLRMTTMPGRGGVEMQMQVIGATTWIASVLAQVGPANIINDDAIVMLQKPPLLDVTAEDVRVVLELGINTNW